MPLIIIIMTLNKRKKSIDVYILCKGFPFFFFKCASCFKSSFQDLLNPTLSLMVALCNASNLHLSDALPNQTNFLFYFSSMKVHEFTYQKNESS